MSNSWDELLRMLVRANPQDFVSLVSSGTHYLSDITQKLITRTIEADFLCKAVRNNQEVVVHIEFQRAQDENMGKRMWEYNCITSFLTRLPVCSSVIYLWKDSNIVEPPYRVTLIDGKVIHILYYDNIFLWEMPPEILKQKGLEGLLPLLPLTKDANKTRDQVVGDMINGLRAVGKEDLLALGYIIAGRVYDTEDDQQWLKRRFEMFHGPLEESWPYREIVQKGYEKGIAQGIEKGIEQGIEQGIEKGIEQGIEQGELRALRPVLVRMMERRFTELTHLAQQQAERITSPILLSSLIDKLFTVQTSEQARHMLMEIEQTPDSHL
jgi:predicted transposase YdaD